MVVAADSRMIGVIGLGSVGHAIRTALGYFFECVGFDIVGNYSWQDILETDAVFVCVPTPEDSSNRLDCSHIDSVLTRLMEADYRGLVIIKSTVRVGYMEEATEKFGQLRIVYMPEFLRERSSFVWFVSPDRLVVSGASDDVEEALSYFHWVEDAEILKLDHRSAEIGKLAHNAFIATKVSFTNEIEYICEELGGNAKGVMSVIWADRRVKSREHLKPSLGPYGGKCVPKDTRELISAALCTDLLEAAERVNRRVQQESEQGDR